MTEYLQVSFIALAFFFIFAGVIAYFLINTLGPHDFLDGMGDAKDSTSYRISSPIDDLMDDKE